MQHGSGYRGLVWVQLLQPLSTESACQLLQVDIAEAPKMFIRRDFFHACFQSMVAEIPNKMYLFPMTKDSYCSHKVEGQFCFLGKIIL
jgi:hypothetical protein